MGIDKATGDTPTEESEKSSQTSVVNTKQDNRSEEVSPVTPDPQNEPIPDQENEISYQYLTFATDIATEPAWPSGVPPTNIPPVPNHQQHDDPFGWSLTRKNWMTYLACANNAIAAYASGSYASPAAALTAKWHVSHVAFNAGITVFTAGFGVAPMVLAPFSEINGRRPVFLVTGVVFVVCQMWCALTQTFGGMLAARFFLGVGGSTFSAMVGGILADIWVTKDRNTPMVLFTGATLFGTGLGPLVSGFVAQRLLWRWVFYIQIVTSSVLFALVAVFFRETRGPVLLSRKAKLLNEYYERLEAEGALGVVVPQSEALLVSTGTAILPPKPANEHNKPKPETSTARSSPTTQVVRLRYRVKSDEERASIVKMISVSLYRPMHMLITEPVVFWFSLWISFSWGVLYLQFGSIPLVFETNHAFTLEQTGMVFVSMCVGAVLMTVLCVYQEKWGLKYFPDRIGGSPEGRLYFACVESAFLPVGLFMFGWTCSPSIHWIVPTIAVAFMTAGIFSIFLAVFNYSADVYRVYASSALAGLGICRQLLGGSFPLVTVQMFENLGYQAASSLLGGIAVVLTFVPWVLVFYGPRIRARSRIAVAFLSPEEKEWLDQRGKVRRRGVDVEDVSQNESADASTCSNAAGKG